MPATTTTTSNHGSHTRNLRSGSSTSVTRKSLIACVPPMIGTPLRRLSCTQPTASLIVPLMSTVSASGMSLMSASFAMAAATTTEPSAISVPVRRSTFGSLMSGGRVAWNVVTSATDLEAQNAGKKKAAAQKKGPGKKAAADDTAAASGSMLDSNAIPPKEVFQRYFGRMLGTQYSHPDAVQVHYLVIPPEVITGWLGPDSGWFGVLAAVIAGAATPGGPVVG